VIEVGFFEPQRRRDAEDAEETREEIWKSSGIIWIAIKSED
jgi:hypothetical protein